MGAQMNLRAAHREIARKSDKMIERETAYKWAGRALACHARSLTATGESAIKWRLQAEEYKNEALEHAALVKDYGRTLKTLEKELCKHMRRKKRNA